MLKRTAAHPAKHITAQEAAGLVRSEMWLDYGMSLSQPDVFDAALAARAAELTNVKVRSALSLRPRQVLEVDPEGKHFHVFSWHFSGYDRSQHDKNRCNYIPLNLGETPDYYRRFIEPVDIVIVKTCPMDGDGNFNFSATNAWHRAIIERAKMVIVEVTPRFPYVPGGENAVHVSEVDYIIDGDPGPTIEFPNPPPSEADSIVAHLIAEEVGDRACIQVGIGAMPNAVCAKIVEGGAKDLGIHTEMLTDGLVDLYKSGAVTGAHKALDPGKVTFTFALGTQALYDAIDHNDDMLCAPVDYTNAPHMIMRNDNVISINSTTQIDLQGQAASESDGRRHLTGTGGQLQFVRGAYASKGGKSFICMSSTYAKKDVRKSRIVFDLTPGNIVTTPRSDTMYVVTEFGMANLKGRSVCERARSLINLAHPDFREDLERQAYEHRLIPRGVSFGAACHVI